MPFNAYVVYETASPHLIRGFGYNQAAADQQAGEDADWSAHQGQVSDIPDNVLAGVVEWFFDVANVRVTRVALTTSDIVVERRSAGISLAQALEKVEGLAAWTAGELNAVDALSIRAKSYARWVELLVRALAVDNNLSTDLIWTVLLRELSHPGRLWYWLHKVGGDFGTGDMGGSWTDAPSFTSDSRLGWTWYSTTGPDAFDPSVRIAAANALTPNTRGYVQGAQVIENGVNPSVNVGAEFNWIQYIA